MIRNFICWDTFWRNCHAVWFLFSVIFVFCLPTPTYYVFILIKIFSRQSGRLFKTSFSQKWNTCQPCVCKIESLRRSLAIFSSIFSIQYSRLFFNRIFRFSQSSRASFKTWANDAASYKHSEFREATLESCLDHRHEKYANAYDREQALGDMRRVFDAWGEFCFSKLTEEQKKRLGLWLIQGGKFSPFNDQWALTYCPNQPILPVLY